MFRRIMEKQGSKWWRNFRRLIVWPSTRVATFRGAIALATKPTLFEMIIFK